MWRMLLDSWKWDVVNINHGCNVVRQTDMETPLHVLHNLAKRKTKRTKERVTENKLLAWLHNMESPRLFLTSLLREIFPSHLFILSLNFEQINKLFPQLLIPHNYCFKAVSHQQCKSPLHPFHPSHIFLVMCFQDSAQYPIVLQAL